MDWREIDSATPVAWILLYLERKQRYVNLIDIGLLQVRKNRHRSAKFAIKL